MYDDKVLLALLSIIGTLIGILGFVIKNELGRIRDSVHKLRNSIHSTLLTLEILDEKFKHKLRKDMDNES